MPHMQVHKVQYFFVKIAVVFLVRTNPASSIAKPAAIHITRHPLISNQKLSSTYFISAENSIFSSYMLFLLNLLLLIEVLNIFYLTDLLEF